MSEKTGDEEIIDTLVEQAKTRLERAVAAGATGPAVTALKALLASDDDKTPDPSKAKKK